MILNKITTKITTFLKKKKVDKRRRSNWYIYLISFAATSLLLVLFITAFQDILFPSANMGQIDPTGRMNYVPQAELNASALFMMSDEPGSIPSLYMLVDYRPRDGAITVVPLSEDTRLELPRRNAANSGTLVDLYRTGGTDLVLAGISETFGIDCDYHVTFNRASFSLFTSQLGDVQVSVPALFQAGNLVLSVGEHMLSGGDWFTYMNYAEFAQAGENFRLEVMAQTMAYFINTNLRNKSEDEVSTLFTRVLNNSTTNLTFQDLAAYQRALHHTSNNAINPTVAYVPTTTREGHELVLSADSITEIKNKFGVAGQ